LIHQVYHTLCNFGYNPNFWPKKWRLWQVFKWHDIKHEDLAKIKYEKKFWTLISKSLEYENLKRRRIRSEESASKTFKQKLKNAFLRDQKICHITTFGSKNLGWDQNLQQLWYLKTKKFKFKKWTIFVSDKIQNQKCILHFVHFEVVLYEEKIKAIF